MNASHGTEADAYAGMEVRDNVPLAEVATFRLGGSCRRLVACPTPDDLVSAARACRDRGEPFLVFGGGSNLLISDHGYDGTVLRFHSDVPGIETGPGTWSVTGCTILDDLARLAASEGLEGVNCCHGIPGTVGGAIVGNAGAWGRQIGDALDVVTVLDPDGSVHELPARALGFGYRHSNLKKSGQVVLRARFRLVPGSADACREERDRILAERAEKHPDLEVNPCIGSIFRNVEPRSDAERRQAAGWFLEQAGAKTMQVGGARVFPRHANIIVKGPGCTAQHVRDLADRMRRSVQEKFGLALEREVRFLGLFRGEEEQPTGRFF